MAERNKRKVDPSAKEMSPKEIRLRARHQEHDRKLYLYVGSAIGVALVLILVGVIYTFLWIPRSTFASLGDEGVTTQQFWNRMRYEKNSLQGQLAQYQAMEQQFGNQGFFTNQINQAQSTLSSSFALAAQTLDKMLEEKIVLREAAKRGITVSDEEIEKTLREEIANQQGLITEPQATETVVANATATADANATATATAQFTPEATVSEAISGTEAITVTEALSGTVAITDTAPVATATTAAISDTATVSDSATLSETAVITSTEISVAEAISGVTAITDTASLTEAIELAANEAISPTATPEPIPTRAIITETLYSESQSTLEANLDTVANFDLSTYREIIRARLLTEKLREAIGADVATTEEQVKARHILLREILPTPTTIITDTTMITPTATEAPLPEGAPTPTPTDAPRTMDEAMEQAIALKAQIDAGEDFAKLATIYSDDTGSGINGGDLGWFGKGAMVPEFEQQAYALEPGQVSQPFTTTFGVHILKVDEKDAARPKEQQAIDQERAEAYDTWLKEQLAAEDVKRPTNLTGDLPRDLR